MRLNSSIEESKSSINDNIPSLKRKKSNQNDPRQSMVVQSFPSGIALTEINKIKTESAISETSNRLNIKAELSKAKNESKAAQKQNVKNEKSIDKNKNNLKKFFSTELNIFNKGSHFPPLPPPPPPPPPPFSSLRDLPSLASLPSMPNSFMVNSVNSATFTSTTASIQSRNHFISSSNVLIASTSDSKTSNSSRGATKQTDSNSKQGSKAVSKMITNKMDLFDKLLNKGSTGKLSQEQAELKHSKQLQKQRIQLYDRINMQNKLKEHTYSPLHFWNEKKIDLKKSSKNSSSMDQLTTVNKINTNKKGLKNYISYKLKTDFKNKTKPKTETKKKESNLSSNMVPATKQLESTNKQKKAIKIKENEPDLSKNDTSKYNKLNCRHGNDIDYIDNINEEYNYAISQRSISTSESQSSNENDDYVANTNRKEYEIKIISKQNNFYNKERIELEKPDDYEDPKFQNEYDDVDDNVLNDKLEAPKADTFMTLEETLIVISAQQVNEVNTVKDEHKIAKACDCKNEHNQKRKSVNKIRNKPIEASNNLVKKIEKLDINKDSMDIIACTSF